MIGKKKGGGQMRTVDTQAYLNTVCQMLDQGQTGVPVPVAGTSMCPFLHHGDMVYLEPPGEKPAVGDILLFRRPSGEYILHRVVGMEPDGRIRMLGDSQLTREVISPDWIRGKVISVCRKGNLVGPEHRTWRLFQHLWVWLIPVRRPILALHGLWRSGNKLRSL